MDCDRQIASNAQAWTESGNENIAHRGEFVLLNLETPYPWENARFSSFFERQNLGIVHRWLSFSKVDDISWLLIALLYLTYWEFMWLYIAPRFRVKVSMLRPDAVGPRGWDMLLPLHSCINYVKNQRRDSIHPLLYRYSCRYLAFSQSFSSSCFSLFLIDCHYDPPLNHFAK